MDEVLAGRRVEMVERADLSGALSVFRFDGQGLVVRFRELDGSWSQDAGSLVLGINEGGWSFDNWLEAVTIP